MPRKRSCQSTIDQLLDRTAEARSTAPVVDYLALSAAADTTAQAPVQIRKVAERVQINVDKNILRLPLPDSQTECIRSRLAEEFDDKDPQYIEKLLEDTDPSGLLPPEHESKKSKSLKDDWNRIDMEKTCLVSQRLLKSYQIKRQKLRNDKKERDENYRKSLKSEYLGYRRFSPYSLNCEKEIQQGVMAQIEAGELTEENREVNSLSLVVTLAMFPPRSKGVQTRQACEYKVLHTTKLSDLFDMFDCPCNKISTIPGEVFAKDPDTDPFPHVEDEFPDQWMFVHDTFYYDNRKSLSKELAEQVKDFIDNHAISVPAPRELVPIVAEPDKGFNDVEIQDLTVNLGYPYLFQHAHDCEHLVVFMDMRVINAYDPQKHSEYPLLTNKPTPRRVLCNVCSSYSAKWETRQNEEADEDPSFWCDECFRSFHYDKDGKMTHNFLAKPFLDPSVLYGNMK